MTIAYLCVDETALLLQVRKDLERHEGMKLYAYADPLSALYKKVSSKLWGTKPAREFLPDKTNWDSGKPWTVGIGDTHGVTVDSVYSPSIAYRRCEEHVLDLNHQLTTLLPWYATGASFTTKTILLNMAYNMGIKGLLEFRNTLTYVKQGDYKQAAANMKKSLWYKQTGNRAKELATRMEKQAIEPQHAAPRKI